MKVDKKSIVMGAAILSVMVVGQALAEEGSAERAADATFGVMDIVNATLQSSPNIMIKGAELEVARGQEMLKAGDFDMNLFIRTGVRKERTINAIPSLFQPKEGVNPVSGQTYLREYNDLLSIVNNDELSQSEKQELWTAMGMSGAFNQSLLDTQYDNHDKVILKYGTTKKFRSGVNANLELLMREDKRLPDSPDSAIPAQILQPVEYTTDTKFTLTVPLLKGRGEVSAAADENEKRLEREAAQANLLYTTSKAVHDSIVSYWSYVAAVESHKAEQRSQKRMEKWLNQAVDGRDKILTAYLQGKGADLIDSAQAVKQARIALAQATGTAPDQLSALGNPSADFPLEWEGVLAAFDGEKVGQAWKGLALKNRNDFLSSRKMTEAGKVQVDKWRQDKLPELNFYLETKWTGRNYYDGFWGSIDENTGKPDVLAMLLFNYPLGNNTAKGASKLYSLQHQKRIFEQREKGRSIVLQVRNEVANAEGRLKKVVQARGTSRSYYDAIEEMVGDASLFSDKNQIISLLELEEKRSRSVVDYFQALSGVAKSIVSARFKTGTLVSPDGGDQRVRLIDLKRYPSMGDA